MIARARSRLSGGVGVMGCLLVVLATLAGAAPPSTGLGEVRARIDRIVGILQAPGLPTKARRRSILAEAGPAFDWPEMARASLGPAWHDRTPAEQREFTHMFRVLVEDSYMKLILHQHGERVLYGRASVDGDRAWLPTQIKRPKGPPISVDYELVRRGANWLVVDVLIENVGLVGNYHSQFANILSRSSYRGLVDQIKHRIASLA